MPNSMSIENFVATAKLLPSNISILLRGETGIGKSQITHQLGKHFKLQVTDRRLSQMTDGDMIGLPSTDGEVTRFNPPDWYKDACKHPRLLFLDELNRATTEVMQAAFQIVLDRELNGWKLHPDTRVYCAINIGSKFTVNEMDPALLRRFFVIDLEPNLADWVKWAQNPDPDFGGNIHEVIIDFHRSTNGKWLDPAKNAEPNSVQPTRHTWERLDKTLKHASLEDSPTDPHYYHISMGFLGVEPTIAFTDFAKNQNSRITGDDIMNHYPKVKSKMKAKNMTVDKVNAIIDRTVDFVNNELKRLTDAQGANLVSFAKDLDKELRLVLWNKLVQSGVNNIELAKDVHKHMHQAILDVFGVPAGDKGVGVAAKIPESLQK